jgi:anti-sigma B factor antagonist
MESSRYPVVGAGDLVVIRAAVGRQWTWLSTQPARRPARQCLEKSECDWVGPTVDDFQMSVSENGGAAVVTVTGELDLGTAPRLREELIGLVSRGIRAVTVDMSRLDFIDSTGLAVLISGLKRLRELGGDLILQSLHPRTVKVFEITGLTRVFTIT